MTAKPPVDRTPDEIIAEAEAEYAAAREHVKLVESQIAAGDETLTADDLDKAKSVSRFAELRRAAADRKAEKVAAKRERARVEAVIDENLIKTQGLVEQIDPLLKQAQNFIDQAIALTKEHDQAVFAIARLAETTGNPYAPDSDPDIVGQAPEGVPSLSWFRTRGVQGEFYGSKKVLSRLTAPYRNLLI